MSRYGKWSEEKIIRYQNEGRGKGTGAAYQPWIETFDLSSQGESRRVPGYLINRVHHLLSNIEFQFFLLAEATDTVIDIREQYPLPRDITQEIASAIGVKHPIYPGTKVPCVMTCDFLITRINATTGEKTLEAYDCKSASEISDPRTLEKLELHRRFFTESSVPHRIVLDSMLPSNKISNLEWIRDASIASAEIEPYPGYYAMHADRFLRAISQQSSTLSLAEYCAQYDQSTGAQHGTGLRVARLLLLKRELITDLNQPNLADAPVAIFRANNKPQLRLANIK